MMFVTVAGHKTISFLLIVGFCNRLNQKKGLLIPGGSLRKRINMRILGIAYFCQGYSIIVSVSY